MVPGPLVSVDRERSNTDEAHSTLAPDVNGISSDIPENCYVDQAAYVLRHGSRYPDTGAHNGWVEMARRVSA